MDRRVLVWLLRVARPERGGLVGLTAVSLLHGGSGVLYALVLRGMVDAAAGGDKAGFLRNLALGVLLVVWLLGLHALLRRLDEVVRVKLENDVRRNAFSALLRGSYAHVSNTHSGEWSNLLATDTQAVANGLAGIAPSLAGALAKILGAFALLASFDLRFALLLGAGWVLFVPAAYLSARPIKRLYQAIRLSDGHLRSFMQERIEGVLVIKAFAAEEQTLARADGLMGEYGSSRLARNAYSNLFHTAFGGAMSFASLAAAAWCAHGMLAGTTSMGTLAATIQLVSQVHGPIASMVGYASQWTALVGSAERLMGAEAAQKAGLVASADSPARSLHGFKAVGFRNVSFAYPQQERDAVHGLSFELRRGEFVALKGQSGCGKSTVLKLVLGAYEPNAGVRYLIDGEGGEVGRFGPQNRLFAYVPQGKLVSDGTIREAVCLTGPESPNEDRLWWALRVACADGFVRRLPDGVETSVGERGTRLSEGQAQRIAVARAVYSGRPILLLDEATSALDEDTEARLLGNLRTLDDVTVMLVAHHSLALSLCDRVIALDGGEGR